MKTNAKQELLAHIDGRSVDHICIAFRTGYGEFTPIEGSLEEVLPLLDFNYDSGYGGQYLFGYIWYSDGTWSERGEYDGSEWWQHQKCPAKMTAAELFETLA
jgi:hypothetical protein